MTKDQVITSLKHHFLVSMPSLEDGVFTKSVVYICNHDVHEGAMGVVINHPMEDVTFDEIAMSMGHKQDIIVRNPTIFEGGPVEHNRGFIVHSDDYSHEDSLPVGGKVILSANAEIVTDIASGKGPRHMNFCLGYAGWNPGQMEDEIARGDWLIMPADEDILFTIPIAERYTACMKILGANSPHFVEATGVA